MGIFIPRESRDRPFTLEEKILFILENGPYCHFCSNSFILTGTEDLIDEDSFEVHHKKQLAKGGFSIPENAQVMCHNCHDDIHFFVDMFCLEDRVDYEFLTLVYIYFFASSPTPDLKTKYSYLQYARNIRGVSNRFWDYVRSCKKETQVLVFSYYKIRKYDVTNTLIIQKRKVLKSIVYKHKSRTNIFEGVLSLGYEEKLLFGKYRPIVLENSR